MPLVLSRANWYGRVTEGEAVTHVLRPGRRGWVQVVRGAIEVNGQSVSAGDGVAVRDEPELTVRSRADGSEVLVFDLP